MPSSRHPVIRGFYFYMYFLRGVRALPPVERQGAALYYRERRSQLQVNAAGALLHDCGPSKEQYGIQKLESSTRGASCCYSSRPHCYSITETLSVGQRYSSSNSPFHDECRLQSGGGSTAAHATRP